jgi:hypothetical protein
LTAKGWIKVETPTSASEAMELGVEQGLNQPPVLSGHVPHAKESSIIWDPNPQLKSLALGKASIYQWHDKEGNSRSGILVLPTDYIPSKHYPLVLQTHGYEPNKFFADGKYTTGSGGRALAAKGIVILQMDQPETNIYTPKEGPFQTEGFISAIQQLAADGLVDLQLYRLPRPLCYYAQA